MKLIGQYYIKEGAMAAMYPAPKPIIAVKTKLDTLATADKNPDNKHFPKMPGANSKGIKAIKPMKIKGFGM